MGYKELEFTLPTDYSEEQLKQKIKQITGTPEFTYAIQKKSLDARKKSYIHWLIRVVVESKIFKEKAPEIPQPHIPYRKRQEKVVVAGSGPAGFFAAFALKQAGFSVTLIERGLDVDQRAAGIENFEQGGGFDAKANYAFGEGGAGTFSDGKLTSRTKSIKKERNFIFNAYIAAGGPEEIAYLTHPHLGTDNLKTIVKNLRKAFTDLGGVFKFNTQLLDVEIQDQGIKKILTSDGWMECDYLFIAPGHSAFETYRMLINRGIPFRNKNFAIGCRVEHPQSIINMAQWGCKTLIGVKAAEYRLTSDADRVHPVYTFCMCPGGVVVPATAYEGLNIVNGMSRYLRDGEFANAACVAGIQIESLLKREVSPLETLDWLENLEHSFFNASPDYKAPAATIKSFLRRKATSSPGATSFPLGLREYPLWELLPDSITGALIRGLRDFSGKIRGFDEGTIMGLESKTSAPIQVVRDKTGRVEGFENLYIIGEGSGFAGGIISSAADGIRAAMELAETTA